MAQKYIVHLAERVGLKRAGGTKNRLWRKFLLCLQPAQRLADTRTGESFKSAICRPPPARSLRMIFALEAIFGHRLNSVRSVGARVRISAVGARVRISAVGQF